MFFLEHNPTKKNLIFKTMQTIPEVGSVWWQKTSQTAHGFVVAVGNRKDLRDSTPTKEALEDFSRSETLSKKLAKWDFDDILVSLSCDFDHPTPDSHSIFVVTLKELHEEFYFTGGFHSYQSGRWDPNTWYII